MARGLISKQSLSLCMFNMCKDFCSTPLEKGSIKGAVIKLVDAHILI